jgi:hypothetical protein
MTLISGSAVICFYLLDIDCTNGAKGWDKGSFGCRNRVPDLWNFHVPNPIGTGMSFSRSSIGRDCRAREGNEDMHR